MRQNIRDTRTKEAERKATTAKRIAALGSGPAAHHVRLIRHPHVSISEFFHSLWEAEKVLLKMISLIQFSL